VPSEPIRVDPILDAAPRPAPATRATWTLPSTCSDCGNVGLAIVPSWGLGDALCLACVVRVEVAAEVDAGLRHRLAGRRYAARVARNRRPASGLRSGSGTR